jgi:hypothetical protein
VATYDNPLEQQAQPSIARVEKARYLECDGIFSLIAGVQCRRNGLLAASGVHFWTDIVWHVVFPLLKLSIYVTNVLGRLTLGVDTSPLERRRTVHVCEDASICSALAFRGSVDGYGCLWCGPGARSAGSGINQDPHRARRDAYPSPFTYPDVLLDNTYGCADTNTTPHADTNTTPHANADTDASQVKRTTSPSPYG